ncbi:hypothetical protein FQN54_002387 [Arachnomyces sp. PD_36]|nr:hypothetical protein FQN54_002387 [Arachnomyces sp. PD_36]
MSTSKEEADVIFNRANVSLARSQRLIASWLPPVTAEELANTKPEEQLQKEEDEIFTAVPEKLGLGAPLPKKAADGSWERTELSSNDKLRKQLLGRNWEKMKPTIEKHPGNPNAPKPRPQETREKNAGNNSDDDDSGEGRSSLGKNKRRKTTQGQQDVNEAVKGEQSLSTKTRKGTQSQKAGSYLDEVLSQRKKKKKNKA